MTGPPDAKLRPGENIQTADRTTADQSHPPRHHRTGRGQARRRTQPWYPPLPLTDHQLDGAKAAAEHLLALDLPPLFPLAVIRAIWKRDRKLSVTLARIRGAR